LSRRWDWLGEQVSRYGESWSGKIIGRPVDRANKRLGLSRRWDWLGEKVSNEGQMDKGR